jgi:hypothetical protein
VEILWLWLVGGASARAAVEDYATRLGGIAPELRGGDVIALGVPPGPEVARVLDALRDARIDEELGDREGEAEYVRRWVETREEG